MVALFILLAVLTTMLIGLTGAIAMAGGIIGLAFLLLVAAIMVGLVGIDGIASIAALAFCAYVAFAMIRLLLALPPGKWPVLWRGRSGHPRR